MVPVGPDAGRPAAGGGCRGWSDGRRWRRLPGLAEPGRSVPRHGERPVRGSVSGAATGGLRSGRCRRAGRALEPGAASGGRGGSGFRGRPDRRAAGRRRESAAGWSSSQSRKELQAAQKTASSSLLTPQLEQSFTFRCPDDFLRCAQMGLCVIIHYDLRGRRSRFGVLRHVADEVREATVSETICPDCGERNARGTEFCSACGAFLAWDGQADPEPAPAAPAAGARSPHRHRPAGTTGRREPASDARAPAGAPPPGRLPAAGRSIAAPDPAGRRGRRTDRGSAGRPRLERCRTDVRDAAARRLQRRIDRPGGRTAAGWLAGIGTGWPGPAGAGPAGPAAAGSARLPGAARAATADRGSLSPLRCRQQRVVAVLQQMRARPSWSDAARRRGRAKCGAAGTVAVVAQDGFKPAPNTRRAARAAYRHSLPVCGSG